MRLDHLSDQDLVMRVQAGDREAEAAWIERYRGKVRAEAESFSNISIPADDREMIVAQAFIRGARTWSAKGGANPLSYCKGLGRNLMADAWRRERAKCRVPASHVDSLDGDDSPEPGVQDTEYADLEDWEDALRSLRAREDWEAARILAGDTPMPLVKALVGLAKEVGLPWVPIRDSLYPGLLIRMAPDPGTPESDDLLLSVHEGFCDARRLLLDMLVRDWSLPQAAHALGLSTGLIEAILAVSCLEIET